LNDHQNFPMLPLIGPKKRPDHLFNKFEFPSPKHFSTKFGWNWPSGSWEGDLF